MRIAAYCRVSTEKDEQLDSLVNQKAFFRDYAGRCGHELVCLYADEGISGKQMSNRDQFLRMMRDARRHTFDMLVTKDVSRFARNTIDALTATRELRSLGIEVLFLANNQTILGNSEFVLTMFSAMAQQESENLSARVKFGKNENAKKGRVPNSIFGYRRLDTFTLEPDPAQAAVVRKIFSLCANEGWGARRISQYLIATGVPSHSGDPAHWSPKTVRRILANEIYAGVLTNGKSETVDYLTGARRNKPPGQWYRHERPSLSIVSRELFDEARNIMSRRREQYAAASPAGRFSNRHLFSNLIKCAHCGRSFCRKSYTYKNTRIYWKCTGNDRLTSRVCANNFTLNEVELAARLTAYFQNMLQNRRELVAEASAAHGADSCEYEAERQRLEKSAARSKRRRETLIDLRADGLISADELKEKLAIDNRTLRDAESRLKELSHRANAGNADRTPRAPPDIGRLADVSRWTNSLMREVIERIEVDSGGNVRVLLRRLDG